VDARLQVLERQAAMQKAQHMFMYPSSAKDMGKTAAKAIVETLCDRVQNNPDLQ
jgi:hypothetical protein